MGVPSPRSADDTSNNHYRETHSSIYSLGTIHFNKNKGPVSGQPASREEDQEEEGRRTQASNHKPHRFRTGMERGALNGKISSRLTTKFSKFIVH